MLNRLSPPANRWRFLVGTGRIRTVVVRAANYEQACERARHELDKRYERSNDKPSAWSLTLMTADYFDYKTP